MKTQPNKAQRAFSVARLAAAYSSPLEPNEWIVFLGNIEWAACPSYEVAKSFSRGCKDVRIVRRASAFRTGNSHP